VKKKMDEVIEILNELADDCDNQDDFDNQDDCEYPEFYIDEDAQYEEWREAQAESLENDLYAVLNSYFKNNLYYSGCVEKLKQHAVESIKNWGGN